MDASRPSQSRSLGGHIGSGGAAASDQPLGEGGVETAGYGVLDELSLVVGEEGSDFEVDLTVFRVWADHTDVDLPVTAVPADVRLQRENDFMVLDQDATQPGPLSTHSVATMTSGLIPRTAATLST